MTFKLGHWVDGMLRFFPHTCPGEGCAIWGWLFKKHARNQFASVLKGLGCDCIASGNPLKPKQHGADPHAKNCAVYETR